MWLSLLRLLVVMASGWWAGLELVQVVWAKVSLLSAISPAAVTLPLAVLPMLRVEAAWATATRVRGLVLLSQCRVLRLELARLAEGSARMGLNFGLNITDCCLVVTQ